MREIRKKQLEFLDWEIGAFFCFGIRTFYEGHRDFDGKEMPLEGFNPTELDCEQWIRTAKEAGAHYALLTCMHVDGFANWPSAYTDYSVANTPWKNGKGDVVREFVDACRKYDLKIAFYYSPSPFGKEYMNDKEFDDYFVNMISELLTNYGTIDYLWLDGCGCEGHEYDINRYVSEIRRMQPEVLIFNLWDPDTRWPGNESGLVPMPNYNVVNEVDFSILTEDKTALSEKRFLPAECDCRMRSESWFYSDADEDTVKSLDELMGLYYYSVGKGANLLINIGPDRRGLLPEKDASAFIALGKKVKEMFSNSVAGMEQTTREGNTYTICPSEPALINHVVLEEVMDTAEHVEKFSVYAYPFPYGKGILIYQGTTIGHKHICYFPTVRVKKVEVVIEKENTAHTMKDISLYYC